MDHKTGDLWLGTGDNTNPFASDGFTRRSTSRPGRAAWDAQRSSGNTNDLSGKVLRITPQPDGTYTIPSGNLFAPGTEKTKPEIYGMGFRNPFRIGLDPKTGNVMVADYGPDSGSANATRGPRGTVEWNALSAARQLRLAAVRRQQHALHRLQLRDQDVRFGVQLRQRRSTTRRTTPV